MEIVTPLSIASHSSFPDSRELQAIVAEYEITGPIYPEFKRRVLSSMQSQDARLWTLDDDLLVTYPFDICGKRLGVLSARRKLSDSLDSDSKLSRLLSEEGRRLGCQLLQTNIYPDLSNGGLSAPSGWHLGFFVVQHPLGTGNGENPESASWIGVTEDLRSRYLEAELDMRWRFGGLTLNSLDRVNILAHDLDEALPAKPRGAEVPEGSSAVFETDAARMVWLVMPSKQTAIEWFIDMKAGISRGSPEVRRARDSVAASFLPSLTMVEGHVPAGHSALLGHYLDEGFVIESFVFNKDL